MGNFTSVRKNNEDGYGEYYVHLRISHIYSNLFSSSTVFNTVQNVSFSSVKSILDGDSYSIETQNIELEFDENKNKTANDTTLISEVLDSTSGTGSALYFGVYITNSSTPTFDYNDFVFIGKLTDVTVDADVTTLNGTEWNKTLGKKIYKMTCQNFQDGLLRSLQVSDMLDSSVYQLAIDTYSFFGDGYYYNSDLDDAKVYTGKLLDLSDFLNYIFGYLALSIPELSSITCNSKAKVFDGLPARWTGDLINGYGKSFDSPYCSVWFKDDTDTNQKKFFNRSYKTDKTDISSLYLDFTSTTTPQERVFVSSVIFSNTAYKNLKGDVLEENESSIPQYSIKQYKSIYDLLFAIAENLDLVLTLQMTDCDKLELSFVAKRDYIKSQKYFKDATSISLKATNEVDEETESEKPYYGRSYYNADEGWKIIVDGVENDDKTQQKKKGDKKLLFSISPTELCHNELMYEHFGIGEKILIDRLKMPLNTYITYYGETVEGSAGWTTARNFLALHSGIYANVDKFVPISNTHTPTNYYTPIAQIIEKIDTNGYSEDRVFERMDDFLNRHYHDVRNDFSSEIEIEIPYCQGFSSSNTGSLSNWQNIVLGDFISFGTGSEFMITEIERDFINMTTNLRGIGKSAFDAYTAFAGDLPLNEDSNLSFLSSNDNLYSGLDLDPTRPLCMVNDANTAIPFLNLKANYNRLIGFWANSSVTTTTFSGVDNFRKKDLYTNESLFTFTLSDIGKNVYAKQTDLLGNFEYTLTQYTADSNNEMLILVGTVFDINTIKIEISNEVFN